MALLCITTTGRLYILRQHTVVKHRYKRNVCKPFAQSLWRHETHARIDGAEGVWVTGIWVVKNKRICRGRASRRGAFTEWVQVVRSGEPAGRAELKEAITLTSLSSLLLFIVTSIHGWGGDTVADLKSVLQEEEQQEEQDGESFFHPVNSSRTNTLSLLWHSCVRLWRRQYSTRNLTWTWRDVDWCRLS